MSSNDQQESFLSVLQRHKGIIYKIANAYCKDPEDRKDLVQEMIIQLWKSFGSYNSQYQYSTWIYRIALNVAISAYRKDYRHQSRAVPMSLNILETDAVVPSVSDKKNESLLLLQSFINELKAFDKALMLLYLEEKSHKEIAEIMGISTSNVATKISRIKMILKQKFLTLNT